jgi:hypothetical protein
VVPHCAVFNSFLLKVYGCLLEGILFVLLHHWVRHSAIWRAEVWHQKNQPRLLLLPEPDSMLPWAMPNH